MQILKDVQQIIREAQQSAFQSINKAMVVAYWLVGKRIVEEEQQGENRAAYGKAVIRNMSDQLVVEFGKGFSVANLQNMRLFYLEYPIQQTLSVKLNPVEKLLTPSAELQVKPISETLSRE